MPEKGQDTVVWLTQVVLEKRPLNRSSSSSSMGEIVIMTVLLAQMQPQRSKARHPVCNNTRFYECIALGLFCSS